MSTQLQRQVPAVPRRVDPMEILDAENAAANLRGAARVVGAIRKLPDPDCLHPMLSAVRSAGTYADLSTHYGYCPECDDDFVVTEWANGEIESRPMTAAEQERFGAEEDRAQRSEWLDDYQAGV